MPTWPKRLVQAALPAGVYESLKTRYLVRRFPRRVEEHEFGGVRLRMAIEDPLAADWYTHDWPEPKEVAVLRDHGVGPGSRVFDLGAHQGLMALLLARMVGDGGSVVAVEAGRHNVEVMRRNLALNGVRNVEALRAAVGAESGELAFAESLCGAVGGPRVAGRVEAVTIDALAERYGPPDAVLVDVEGAEELALRGAKATIARGSLFVVELHVGCGLEELGGSVDEVLAAFSGYRLLASAGDESGGWARPVGPMTRRTFLLAVPFR